MDGHLQRRKRNSIILGAVVGLVYGVSIRLLIQLHAEGKILSVMSVAFLALVPVAVGFVSVYSAERLHPQSWLFWIFFPWVPVVAACLFTLLVFWEGMICAVMFMPIGLFFSTLGGIIGGFVGRGRRTLSTNAVVGMVLLLPLVVGHGELHLKLPRAVRSVESTIDIHTDSQTVWANIERVPAIHAQELTPSWSHRIGFPDPVEATLSHEGVGGIRHATFKGGVLFIETIDAWEPGQRLAFSIHPDAEHIPETTFDEHVKVGGPYFDVLRGEYRLEPLPGGIVRLHLTSQHRVSTDFNWYAQLWTDGFMRDIQGTILRVIKNRCEAARPI